MGLSKREKTRHLIMHTAKQLIEESGGMPVTFGEIAERADICRTTVFNHFKCTNDLICGIFMQEMEDLEAHLKDSDLTGLSYVLEMFNQLIEDVSKYPAMSIKLANNAILYTDYQNPIFTLEKLVEKRLEEDHVMNADRYSTIIVGAYFGLLNHYKISGKDFVIDEMKQDFSSMMKLILGGYYHE